MFLNCEFVQVSLVWLIFRLQFFSLFSKSVLSKNIPHLWTITDLNSTDFISYTNKCYAGHTAQDTQSLKFDLFIFQPLTEKETHGTEHYITKSLVPFFWHKICP